jgi:hypothetical protein
MIDMTVNEPITDAELADMGREDGVFLFEVFECFMDQANRPVETMLLAFDEWSKVQLLSVENRLRETGLGEREITVRTDGLVAELNRLLRDRAERKNREA